MAYYIMMGDDYIYHPLNPKYSCRSASATWGVNEIESLTFTVEYDHPLINEMDILRNDIQLNFGDNTQLALGRYRIIKKTLNWDKSLTVECEGMLAVLNDTVIAPYDFTDSTANCVRNFLSMFVTNHNAQVGNGTSNTLYVGDVTVTDSNNYVGRSTDTFKTSWEAMKEGLIGTKLGGYIRARYYGNQGIYIDYLADFEESSQSIDFGVNLLDLTDEFDASEFYTAIYPVGKDKLTLEAYPDYSSGGFTKVGRIIKKDSLVDTFGIIVSMQEWSDVSTTTVLNQKAKALLGESLPIDSISATALDLHLLDSEIDELEVGTKVSIYSLPHGIDTILILSQKTIDVVNPASSTLTLGRRLKTLTSVVANESGGAVGIP